MELDLQRTGVAYIEPVTTDDSSRTFWAEKEQHWGKEKGGRGLGTGEFKEPGETSFKIQKRMGITDGTRFFE